MAIYKTIHTSYGLTRMAQAEAGSVKINLPMIAVGDGGGNSVTPTEGQAQLVREVYRAAVNRVFQDPNTPSKFTAELAIPASVGGFVLREIGVFDDQGGLFVVGNLPATYKPNASEGAYSDTFVRVEFLATNANIVSVQIDPNVALASQAWVSNNVTAGTLLPGGLTGQILAKQSNIDGDVIWKDPTSVNVVVTTVEEKQTLAANQTQVDLVKTNTSGLAIYIEGNRLRSDEWTPDPTIKTRLVLAKAYTAGFSLTAVQNEPAQALASALQVSLNLSDVANPAAARQNLGVPSKADCDQYGMPGDVKYTTRATAPTGWLKANGAAVSRAAYAALFAAIGTAYGAGDGFNTFNLPDLRGEFLRGLDDGRGVDAGRTLGSNQAGQNQSHAHAASADAQGAHAHGGSTDTQGQHSHPIGTTHSGNAYGGNDGWQDISNPGSNGVQTGAAGAHSHNITTDTQGTHSHTITISPSGGNEARPRNVALLACIKY